MKVLWSILLSTLFLYKSNSVNACQCLHSADDFFAALYYQLNDPDPGDTIHIVKGHMVNNVGGYGITFKVLHYYCGSASRDTITIWGYTGLSCRLSYVGLTPEDTIILLLNKNLYRESASESTNDFEASNCGYYFLRAKGDSVYGGAPDYAFSYNGYPLSLFEDSLCKVIPNSSCLPTSIVCEEKSINGLKVFPNPATSSATLTWYASKPNETSVKLIDATGRVVKSIIWDKSTIGNQEWNINLSGLAAGWYRAVIRSSSEVQSAPLIIQSD